MADRHPKLKLGKGASFFVKTQLRRLRQEDEIWEADFFPIPCSDSEHSSVWWGLVLSHSHENVLAQRMVEEPPNVNDLAGLLAEAMRRPLVDFSHRPRRLYLRARPEWAELLPHLKQIGIEAVSQDSLAKWDRNFGDLQAQVEQAKASKTKGQHPDDEEENMPDNTENSDTAFRELVRILEEAVQAGVTSLGLEYQGRELIVFHQAGIVGLGAARISEDLQQSVIEELVKRAGLSRKSKGKMQVSLLGKEYEAVVEEYDSFGESAFTITLKELKKKAKPRK